MGKRLKCKPSVQREAGQGAPVAGLEAQPVSSKCPEETPAVTAGRHRVSHTTRAMKFRRKAIER